MNKNRKFIFDSKKTWFTSDLHISHKNVINYCNRPFKDVEEMNSELVKRWNNLVKPDDVVFVLGDFAFERDPTILLNIFNSLNGIKNLVKGNHDGPVTTQLPWNKIRDYQEVNVDGNKLVLSHYSFRVWNGSHRGSISLYGHSHGSLPGTSQSLDVGVDCWNYAPCNIHQILEKLKTNSTYAVEHHGNNSAG